VHHVEQFDAQPFLEAVSKHGLPWKVIDASHLHV
jgi:hypothetical protein